MKYINSVNATAATVTAALALQRKFRFGIQPDGDREWFRVVSIVKFVMDGQGLLFPDGLVFA